MAPPTVDQTMLLRKTTLVTGLPSHDYQIVRALGLAVHSMLLALIWRPSSALCTKLFCTIVFDEATTTPSLLTSAGP
jgi:hypothetical protein